MSNLLTSLLAGHPQIANGAADIGLVLLGAALANPGTCATLLFSVALKVPGFGPWVAANPDKAKAWFDGFDKAIDACVEKYATQTKTPPQA